MSMESIFLNNLADIVSGYAIPSKDMQEEGTPIIKITNIKEDGFLDLDNTAKYSKPISKKLEKYLLRDKDVLVCMTGATIGKIARKQIVNGDFLVNQRVAIIRAKKPKLQDFIYYALSLPSFRKYTEVVGYGAAQPNISSSSIGKYNFLSVSNERVQHRIASILSTYDSLIENNTKRIRLLEKMAENLYKEWFVRFRFPGHENVEMENGLPKGWKVEKLGNLSNISTGKCNREDAEEDGVYPLFDRSQETKRSSKWLKDCEAIIVPGEGTTFMPRYYIGKFNLHQRCYCVEPTKAQIGKFLFYTIMFNRKYFLSVATGATVPSLRYNNFAKMKIIVPSEELYGKYEQVVSKLFKEEDNLQHQNSLLARQRDLLLPRLMSGKLEVKEELLE